MQAYRKDFPVPELAEGTTPALHCLFLFTALKPIPLRWVGLHFYLLSRHKDIINAKMPFFLAT